MDGARDDRGWKTSLIWLWALAGALGGLIAGYLWSVHDVPTCTVRTLGDPGMCGVAMLLLPPALGVGALLGAAVGAALGRPARR